MRPPFNLQPGAIAAGIAALGDDAHLKNVVNHNSNIKSWFIKELNVLGFKAYDTQANFVFVTIPEKKNQNASLLNEYLLSKGIAVRYLKSYGIESGLRITLGKKDELDLALKIIREFVNKNE